jgi:hypothetical protein
MLQMFFTLRTAAFEGGGIPMPPVTTAFAIPELIQQMREEDYGGAAVTLIGVAGDAASAFGFLMTAAAELGTIPALGGMASAGIVATALGEAAGPAAIAVSVLVATFAVPRDVNENNKKLYFIADASGILASWVFNLPNINPHALLTARARRGGYFSADVTEGCRLAHERVHQLWQTNYQGNASAVRSAQASAGNGDTIAATRPPPPTAHAAESARLAASRRRAAGGYWFRTEDGLELFMPDP